jgi:cytochrome c553
MEQGAAIAARGVPERKVPACRECHGPEGPRRNPAYPSLAGQYAAYLDQQLRLFRAGDRGGSEYAHLMEKVAPRLTDEEIEAVALYYASLEPASD